MRKGYECEKIEREDEIRRGDVILWPGGRLCLGNNVPLGSPGRAGVEMRMRIEDGDGDDDYCVRYSPNQYPYPLPLVEEGEGEYRNWNARVRRLLLTNDEGMR